MSEQIEDNKNGLIADMNAGSIAEKIEQLINNDDLKDMFIDNLKQNKQVVENRLLELL